MTVSIPDVTGNIVITAEAKLPMLNELAVGAVTKLVEKDGAAAEEFVVIAQDYEKELNGEGRTLLPGGTVSPGKMEHNMVYVCRQPD